MHGLEREGRRAIEPRPLGDMSGVGEPSDTVNGAELSSWLIPAELSGNQKTLPDLHGYMAIPHECP